MENQHSNDFTVISNQDNDSATSQQVRDPCWFVLCGSETQLLLDLVFFKFLKLYFDVFFNSFQVV